MVARDRQRRVIRGVLHESKGVPIHRCAPRVFEELDSSGVPPCPRNATATQVSTYADWRAADVVKFSSTRKNYEAALAARAVACAASHSSASGAKKVTRAFLYSRVG